MTTQTSPAVAAASDFADKALANYTRAMVEGGDCKKAAKAYNLALKALDRAVEAQFA